MSAAQGTITIVYPCGCMERGGETIPDSRNRNKKIIKKDVHCENALCARKMERGEQEMPKDKNGKPYDRKDVWFKGVDKLSTKLAKEKEVQP